MKKYLVIVCLFFLVGCSSIKTYDVNHFQDYVDELYLYETGKKQGVVYIDLRPTGTVEGENKDEYISGHIKGFINYDFNQGSKEEFITWIKGLYSLKTAIFLIDDGSGNVNEALTWLQEAGYKKIYGFIVGYSILIEQAGKQLFIVTGLDDCAC